MGKKNLYLGMLLLALGALLVMAPTVMKDDGISVFNGKWVSTRWSGGELTEQSLKIKCNPKKSSCRIRFVVDRSGTCTAMAGEPTGLVEMYSGSVNFEGSTITTVDTVDAYCQTKPPTYLASFFLWYTYNEANDTLTDFGTTWYRK
jgi:hypothetical protein